MMEATEDTLHEHTDEPQPHLKARPRSFFTRKLESKLAAKEAGMPQAHISLLDTPFDAFSPEEQQMYERELKPTFQFLSEILLEVFDELGRPEEGWEESTKLMPDCPAKVVAMLSLYQYRQTAAPADDPLSLMDDYVPPQPAQSARPSPSERIAPQAPPPGANMKKAVKKPSPGKEDQKPGKWWEKKVF